MGRWGRIGWDGGRLGGWWGRDRVDGGGGIGWMVG